MNCNKCGAEIHEYENYDMISVFTSGFGKRKHSRIFLNPLMTIIS